MKVLVTGANGHVGYNLCKALLAKGHQVRASIRNASDRTKAEPLQSLGTVELVGLDIRREDEFAKAVDGVDLLFHVAATYAYYTGSKAKDEEMIRDSVQGAELALRSAARSNLHKVVMTSSAVTLPLTEPAAPPVAEDAWRTDLAVAYFRAKTEAERRAWQLADELGVKLVTILPGAIGGPGFSRPTASIDVFDGIMRGTMRMGAPDANYPYVDIRDVVSGHVLAAEKEASGRYIICNDVLPSFLELAQAMHRIDPSVPNTRRTIPRFAMGVAPYFDWLNSKLLGAPRVLTPELVASVKGRIWNMSNARAKRELGWTQSVSLEQSLKDMMVRIRELRAATAASRTAPGSG